MKPFLLTLCCPLLALVATADENRSLPWDHLVFGVPLEQGRAEVEIKAGEPGQIALKLVGSTLEVPAAELEGLDALRLDSARLLVGEGYYGPITEDEEAIPHYIVEMEYGELSEHGGYPTARFLFHSGAYQERILWTRTSGNTWKETRKAPAEDPIEMGTITRPPAAPAGPATE